MSSGHTNPGRSEQLAEILSWWRSRSAGSRPTIESKREAYERLLSKLPIGGGVTIGELDLGSVPGTVFEPETTPERTVIHFHGGGFVMGSPRGYRSFGVALARAASARVVLIDYRLAPEHRHPAAVNDAVDAWRAARARWDGSIHLSADSAGCAVALGMLMTLRDGSEILPSSLTAMSPWVDLTLKATSVNSRPDDPVVALDSLQTHAALYLGDATASTSPTASPLPHGRFDGLPPALTFVGQDEALYDDAVGLDHALRDAGVPSRLICETDLPHVWPIFAELLPEGAEALHTMTTHLRSSEGIAS